MVKYGHHESGQSWPTQGHTDPGVEPVLARREPQAPRFQVPLGERASGLRSGGQEARRRHWAVLPKLSPGLVKQETKDV